MSAPPVLLTRDRGIIIAADVLSLDDLANLAETCAQIPQVVAVKVGFSLGLRYGLSAVTETIRNVCSIPVIYDHQKAGTDVPQMGEPFAQCCLDAGINGVILFPQAGPRTLEAFVTAIVDANLTPIVGLVMTHDAYLQSEGGFIADESPEIICGLAKEAGVRHFVLPGTKTNLVYRFASGSLSSIRPAAILMPGIGSQGGLITDAFAAAEGHHVYAIIGSAVYRASDPLKVLKEFVAQIK